MTTREAGRLGGRTRAENLNQSQRSEAAAQAARARWSGVSREERIKHARRMVEARRKERDASPHSA